MKRAFKNIYTYAVPTIKIGTSYTIPLKTDNFNSMQIFKYKDNIKNDTCSPRVLFQQPPVHVIIGSFQDKFIKL
jgi:hypothetical protein